jgi:hypothetical protein
MQAARNKPSLLPQLTAVVDGAPEVDHFLFSLPHISSSRHRQ